MSPLQTTTQALCDGSSGKYAADLLVGSVFYPHDFIQGLQDGRWGLVE